jgi:hypothetical protein
VKAIIHIKVLGLLRAVLTASDDIPPAKYIKEVICRQAAMTAPATSSSWVNMSKTLLEKYNLPPISSLIAEVPRKKPWTSDVKKAVYSEWDKQLRETAVTKSTLTLLSKRCTITAIHPVWEHVTSQLDIRKATVKSQLLIQRYPLSTSHTAGKKKSSLCPLCKDEPETTVRSCVIANTYRIFGMHTSRRLYEPPQRHEI